jgi:hypothetical protein
VQRAWRRPGCPAGTADSAEQAWFDLEAEILIAEVENYLATHAPGRSGRTPPRVQAQILELG